jgi:hypothetical protein
MRLLWAFRDRDFLTGFLVSTILAMIFLIFSIRMSNQSLWSFPALCLYLVAFLFGIGQGFVYMMFRLG